MDSFIEALCDDLNMPRAISLMHEAGPAELMKMAHMLGLLQMPAESWFKGEVSEKPEIKALIDERIYEKKAKNWARADEIRKILAAQGILLEDRPDGTTDWRRE